MIRVIDPTSTSKFISTMCFSVMFAALFLLNACSNLPQYSSSRSLARKTPTFISPEIGSNRTFGIAVEKGKASHDTETNNQIKAFWQLSKTGKNSSKGATVLGYVGKHSVSSKSFDTKSEDFQDWSGNYLVYGVNPEIHFSFFSNTGNSRLGWNVITLGFYLEDGPYADFRKEAADKNQIKLSNKNVDYTISSSLIFERNKMNSINPFLQFGIGVPGMLHLILGTRYKSYSLWLSSTFDHNYLPFSLGLARHW